MRMPHPDEPGARRTQGAVAIPRTPRTPRARVGAAGEALAARELTRRGYRVLARNWHCRYGELDIIAEDGSELVFVEVKTRRGTALGLPEEALTHTKRKRLLAAAQQYLMEQETAERPYRFDVVAIELDGRGSAGEVRVYPNALTEE
jgi:putative endonuclease